MKDYKSSSHAVWDCKYHLVWITKYRYPVLVGDASWPPRWARGKIFPYGARRDLYSELQKKLIGDPFLAPCGILAPHAADQILYLL